MRKEFLKKISALILSAVMMLSAIPAQAATIVQPEEGQAVYEGVTYFYKAISAYPDADLEITAVAVPNGIGVLKVPEKLNNKKVIRFNFDSLMENKGTENVRKIVLSKYIRPYESRGESVNTGRYWIIDEVDLWPFQNLEEIEVAAGSKYLKASGGILYDAKMKSLLHYPRNKKAVEYKMPSSIERSSVISNVNLEKITFSKNKKFIEVMAGNACEKLKSIYFPNNIKYVEGFYDCRALTTIRWSKNMVSVEGFSGCSALTRVKLPGKLKSVEQCSFQYCAALKEVVLPEGLHEIGSEAFADCARLKKLSRLPRSLACIEEGAFMESPCMDKVKKAPYLLSGDDRRIKGKIEIYNGGNPDYVAVAEIKKGKKSRYYDSRMIMGLKFSAKKTTLRRGKKKTLSITPLIANESYKNGWKMKTDILAFTSSNPKVAKVTANGRIQGRKKGMAVITVKMRTSDVKRKIKVTVK